MQARPRRGAPAPGKIFTGKSQCTKSPLEEVSNSLREEKRKRRQKLEDEMIEQVEQAILYLRRPFSPQPLEAKRPDKRVHPLNAAASRLV
jgi:hypothetical protein